jgi:hypothetical protein
MRYNLQIGDLPFGTWLAASQPPEDRTRSQKALGRKGGRPRGKKVLDALLTVQLSTPITQALSLLFETGKSGKSKDREREKLALNLPTVWAYPGF